MAIQFSREIEEAMYGNEAVLNSLELMKSFFVSGDRTALFGVIATCARFQAIIPDWAVDEILQVEQSLETGDMKDFNTAFGYTHKHLASRRSGLHPLY
jgi:hypothetical protein